MSTKKPVADPDIESEYDFRDSVPNPYAERYREGHVPLVTCSAGHRNPPRTPVPCCSSTTNPSTPRT